MRRIALFALVTVLGLVMSAVPAGADHYVGHEVNIEPGESVELLDGIFISVDPVTGDVFLLDGIFVEKITAEGVVRIGSQGGVANLEISLGADLNTVIIERPGGDICTKC